MQKVRVGVVGVGYLGQHHARIFSELDEANLQAVVDIDYERAQSIARRTGAKPYDDYRDILGKVDAVTVAVPTKDHYEVARTFLDHGKDVLIEKPITSSFTEASELVQLAADKSLILTVGHLERFNAGVTQLQQMVHRPYYIETQRLAPFVTRSTDIDVVLDLMIHDIDVILSIVGDTRVRLIRAVGHPVLTNSIDMASAWIEFTNGCVANINASRVSKDKIRKIRVFQPENYISLDYSTQQLSVLNRVSNKEDAQTFQLVEERVELKKAEPLRAELEEFVSSVSRRTEPRVTGKHGMEALKLALEISATIQPQIRAFKLPLAQAAAGPYSHS